MPRSRSTDARHAAIEVGSDTWAGAVTPLQLRELEPTGGNHRFNRSIHISATKPMRAILFGGLAPSVYVEHINLSAYIRTRVWWGGR
jgi:hypothetical protein